MSDFEELVGGTMHMMKFTHDTRTHARGKIDFLLILYIFNHKERKEIDSFIKSNEA